MFRLRQIMSHMRRAGGFRPGGRRSLGLRRPFAGSAHSSSGAPRTAWFPGEWKPRSKLQARSAGNRPIAPSTSAAAWPASPPCHMIRWCRMNRRWSSTAHTGTPSSWLMPALPSATQRVCGSKIENAFSPCGDLLAGEQPAGDLSELPSRMDETALKLARQRRLGPSGQAGAQRQIFLDPLGTLPVLPGRAHLAGQLLGPPRQMLMLRQPSRPSPSASLAAVRIASRSGSASVG